MAVFIPGQLWISKAEPELGLGLIHEVAYKRVTVHFLGCNEKRMYAQDNELLERVRFLADDAVVSIDEETVTVTGLIEQLGLITYLCKNENGQDFKLDEAKLKHHIQVNKHQVRELNVESSHPLSTNFGFDDCNGSVPAHRHKNLNGDIGGWVADSATVEATAYVDAESSIYGSSCDYGKSEVFGQAQVFSTSRLSINPPKQATQIHEYAKNVWSLSVYDIGQAFSCTWRSSEATKFSQDDNINTFLNHLCWRRLKIDHPYRLKIDQGELLNSVLYSIGIVDQTELVLPPLFY